MSLHNFLLFHLRRHVKNSGFVLHHGFQIPRNRWKHEACGLVLPSVSRYLEPVIKHSPSFLTYYMKHSHSFLTYYWKTITEWRQVGYWLSFREKVFFATVGFGRRFVGNCAHCCISCHFVWDFYKGDLGCNNNAVSLLFPYYPQIKAK